jgi:hypothetical protein
MSNANFLNEAGDVITEQLIIHYGGDKSVDVTNFVASLTLHEDIFSPILHGDLLIEDAGGLINILQCNGNEYLTIAFRTPTFEEKITKSFYIVSLKNRQFLNTDKASVFTLTFASIEGQRDNLTKINQKYSGNTADLVLDIYTNFIASPRFIFGTEPSPILTSKAASMATFVPAFWTPMRCISWLANRTYASGSSAPNFLFFESNKSFYFTSVEQLIRQQRDTNQLFAEYIYFPGAAKIQNISNAKFSYTKPELGKQYGMVRNMQPITMFDSFDAQDKGFHASRLIVKDMTLKAFTVHDQDYYETHKKFHHLEDYNVSGSSITAEPSKKTQTFESNVPRSPNAFLGLHTKQYKLHDDSTEPYIENWAQQRNSLMYELSNIKLVIEVPGRTDIEVGKVVRFLYPKNVSKTTDMLTDDVLDPFLTGLYFITAIRHNFTLNKHTMYVEIVKDSFAKSL